MYVCVCVWVTQDEETLQKLLHAFSTLGSYVDRFETGMQMKDASQAAYVSFASTRCSLLPRLRTWKDPHTFAQTDAPLHFVCWRSEGRVLYVSHGTVTVLFTSHGSVMWFVCCLPQKKYPEVAKLIAPIVEKVMSRFTDTEFIEGCVSESESESGEVEGAGTEEKLPDHVIELVRTHSTAPTARHTARRIQQRPRTAWHPQSTATLAGSTPSW